MNKSILVLLFLLILSPLSASDMQTDHYFIRVDDESGKFNIYLTGEEGITPVLTETDPISSYWVLIEDVSVVYSPQSSNLQSVQVHKQESGLLIKFDFPKCQVLARLEAAGMDSVSYTIQVINKDFRSHSYRLVQIWDTYTPETNEAYLLSDGSFVSSETVWNGQNIPDWIGVPVNGDSGLYLDFSETRSKPQRIIAINWRKLHENPVSPIVNNGNPFFNYPDMTLDGALGVYYNLGQISTRLQSLITIGINLHAGTFQKPEIQEELPVVDAEKEKMIYTLMLNINLLDDFLKDIDSELDSTDVLLDEDLINFYNRLNELKQIQQEYEQLH